MRNREEEISKRRSCNDNMVELEKIMRIENSENPLKIDVQLNGVILSMEVDTGSPISVISDKIYSTYFEKTIKLKSTNILLEGYSGKTFQPLGKFEVSVNYNNIIKRIEIHVVKNGDSPILGRNFLKVYNFFMKKQAVERTKKEFNLNDIVFAKDYTILNMNQWQKAKVIKKIERKLYIVELEDGRKWKRFLNQLSDFSYPRSMEEREILGRKNQNFTRKIEFSKGVFVVFES